MNVVINFLLRKRKTRNVTGVHGKSLFRIPCGVNIRSVLEEINYLTIIFLSVWLGSVRECVL